MIAVDTNIICYLFIYGEFTEISEKVLHNDHHWAAPFLWRSEFRNIMAVSVRKGLLTIKDALEIVEQAEFLMRGNEYSVASPSIHRLISTSDCSAYDCEFVALAQEHRIPLITMDRKILGSFPDTAMRPKDFIEGRTL